MKHLLLSALLLVGLVRAAHSQVQPALDKAAGVFYELAEEARGFKSLGDTANFIADVSLARGASVFVVSYPTSKWAQCTRLGARFLIPVSALGTYDVPTDTTPEINATSGSAIYVGPKGGIYRINSKGNKTYIKRK